MTLYEVTGSLLEAQKEMEDPSKGGQAVQGYLDELAADFEKKAIGYAKVAKNLEAQSAALGAEIKRLQERKNAADNSISSIKETIKQCLLASGRKNIRSVLFDIMVKNGADKLVIDDADAVPGSFLIPQDPKLDKKALNKWAKEHRDEVGRFGHYEPTKTLVIK